MDNKNKKTSEDYRRYVKEKIDALIPVFAKAAVGDFSNIEIPEDDEEFSQLYIGIDILLDMVRKNIDNLEEANTRLQQEISKRDRFTALLAHELRNPLAPITSSLELIRLQSTDNPELRQEINIIDRQFKHITRLLQDLLDISRIAHGKIYLQPASISLNDIINNALETSRPLFNEERHQLSVSLPEDSVCVYADPMRLEQVIVNILNNAAKYTPPEGHIWVTASHSNNEASIQIRDTGVGIKSDMLPRIFDLFSQGDPSQAKLKGGLGIGLMLAKNLIELQGGTIHVASEGVDKGAEFNIKFPVYQGMSVSSEPNTTPPHEYPEKSSSARKIIIVDDNEDAANTLALILKKLGHQVQCAYSGQVALEVITQSQPDVILLDIGMPDMDGYEVMRRLRETKDFNARVIALTGYGKEEDRQRTKEAGFDRHLVKPVSLNDLREIL